MCVGGSDHLPHSETNGADDTGRVWWPESLVSSLVRPRAQSFSSYWEQMKPWDWGCGPRAERSPTTCQEGKTLTSSHGVSRSCSQQEGDSRRLRDRLGRQLQRCQTSMFVTHSKNDPLWFEPVAVWNVHVFHLTAWTLSRYYRRVVNIEANGCLSLSVGPELQRFSVATGHVREKKAKVILNMYSI